MFKQLAKLEELQKSGVFTKQEIASKIAELKLPAVFRGISKVAPTLVVLAMWGGPSIAVAIYIQLVLSFDFFPRTILLAMSPLLFSLVFVMIGIAIAQASKFGIVEGKFPRSFVHPIYALRRIYGAAWTQVYYFKPLYAAFLAVPFLKFILFRGFGYRGSLDLICYPDTWIRDLPLLRLGSGIYFANRATIGTNMCMNDGSIVVNKMDFGDGVMIGHLATIAPGVTLGRNTEVGVGVGIGLRTTIGEKTNISPRAVINHACKLGDKVIVGNSAYIGVKASVNSGINITAAAIIPAGAQISSQDEADRYFSSEQQKLTDQKDALLDLLKEHLKHGPISATR